MHPGTTKLLTKFYEGSKVLYTSKGVSTEAVILAVHLDDALKPYYTIRIIKDGKEKQTEDDHVMLLSEYINDNLNNNAYEKPEAKAHESYPVQQWKYINGNHTDSFLDDDEDRDYSSVAFLLNKQQRKTSLTPISILRPPSYGTIPISHNDTGMIIGDDDHSVVFTERTDNSQKHVNNDQFTLKYHDAEETQECFHGVNERKRRFEHKNGRRRASKRIRFDDDNSPRNHKLERVNLRHQTSRSRYIKVPSLLRPPIDKRYFLRIKPNQRPTNANKKKIDTTKHSETNECIFTRDSMDSLETRAFDKHSILYNEVTAKAHQLRRLKQQPISLKQVEELDAPTQNLHHVSPIKISHPETKTRRDSPKNLSVLDWRGHKNDAVHASRNFQTSNADYHALRADKRKSIAGAEQRFIQAHDFDSKDQASHFATDTLDQGVQSQSSQIFNPMVTFAPEYKPYISTESETSQPRYCIVNPEQQVEMVYSPSKIHRLPFDFMPVKESVTHNDTIKLKSIVEFGLLIIKLLKSFMIKASLLAFSVLPSYCPSKKTSQRDGTPDQRKNNESISHNGMMNFFQKKALSKREYRPTAKSLYVKNPKELLSGIPENWETLFELQAGEWRCRSCGYKNSEDIVNCDNCFTIKVDSDRSPENMCKQMNTRKPENVTSAMSCDSFISLEGKDPLQIQKEGQSNISFVHDTNTSLSHKPKIRGDPDISLFEHSESKRHRGTYTTGLYATEKTKDINKKAPKKRPTDGCDNNELHSKRLSLDEENLKMTSPQKYVKDSIEDMMDLELIQDFPS